MQTVTQDHVCTIAPQAEDALDDDGGSTVRREHFYEAAEVVRTWLADPHEEGEDCSECDLLRQVATTLEYVGDKGEKNEPWAVFSYNDGVVWRVQEDSMDEAMIEAELVNYLGDPHYAMPLKKAEELRNVWAWGRMSQVRSKDESN